MNSRQRVHTMVVKVLQVLVLMFVTLGLTAFSCCGLEPEQNPNPVIFLENFSSLPDGRVLLDVSGRDYSVALRSFTTRPLEVESQVREMAADGRYRIAETNERGEVNLRLDYASYDQSNLIVFFRKLPSFQPAGYIELLTQSESELERRFAFRKPGGYVVLGRSSISAPRRPKIIEDKQSYAVPLQGPFPDLSALGPKSGSYPEEIRESAAIIRFIWEKPIPIGPSHLDLARLDPLRRLDLLRKKEWSVQCAGIRDIFVDLALASPRIKKVRYVNLYQYYPHFQDLIPQSHAVAEVFCTDLNQWVMVDPHYASIFRLGGKYLSAQELASMGPDGRRNVKPECFVPTRSIDRVSEPGFGIEDSYFLYFGTVVLGPTESQGKSHEKPEWMNGESPFGVFWQAIMEQQPARPSKAGYRQI